MRGDAARPATRGKPTTYIVLTSTPLVLPLAAPPPTAAAVALGAFVCVEYVSHTTTRVSAPAPASAARFVHHIVVRADRAFDERAALLRHATIDRKLSQLSHDLFHDRL